MDSLVYFMAEHYPWWAFPLALILFELTRFFWRNGRPVKTALTAAAAVALVALGVLYFMQDGFRNLRPAMKDAERTYLSK